MICSFQDAPADAVSECQWTVRTDTLFKSHEVSFNLGEWGSDVTMDGRAIKYVVSAGEGPSKLSRLVEVQEDDKVSTTLVRDFSDAGMTVTLTVNGVVATSFFSRQRLPG